MAMANSVSGAVALDIYENTGDETLALTIGPAAGVASGLLELVGFKVAYKGLSPATREVIKNALAKAAACFILAARRYHLSRTSKSKVSGHSQTGG